MDGAWSYDQDLTTWRKARSGPTELVGQEHWRGEWTVTWDALEYEVAQRILYEVGAANRIGTSGLADDQVQGGEFLWTPRTRQPGDPSVIDVDGDGVVDVILEEVELPCRLIGAQPSTTPIYRRKAGGTKVARLQLQIQSTRTYQERPGFGFPPTISFKASGQAGDEVDVEMLGSDGSLTDRVAQVRVRNDGSTIDTFALADFPYSLPEAGDFGFALVAAPDFEKITEVVLAGPTDVSTMNLREVSDLLDVEIRGASGTLQTSLVATETADLRSGTYPCSLIEATEEVFVDDGGVLSGDIGELPSPTTLFFDADGGTDLNGNAPPASWWAGGVQYVTLGDGTNAAIDLDEARQGDTGIVSIRKFRDGKTTGDPGAFLEEVQTCMRLTIADARGDDLSGAKVIPPGEPFPFRGGTFESDYGFYCDETTTPATDYQQCGSVAIVQYYANSPFGLGVDNGADPIGFGSASIDDAVSSPGNLAVTDGLIGALENGIALSQLEVSMTTEIASKSSSPPCLSHDVWDQIISYTDSPTLTIRGDRPRKVLSVDTSPSEGDLAIDVDDPSGTMHDFIELSDDTPATNRMVTLAHLGGVNGRYEAISKSKSSGVTTLELSAGGVTTVGTPDLNPHSTAQVHIGRRT
jgi:hypothetical protein